VKTRTAFLLLSLCIPMVCLCGPCAHALSIGGAVRQPFNLTSDDLANLGQAEVKLTEVTKNAGFNGTFVYRGVSLRTLLTMATVRKEVEGYSKSIDLAILVRNRDGKTAALSWGEVFYRNPGDVIIATSAAPVTPGAMSSCNECHGPEVYQPGLDKLGRRIGFPKLVISTDFYTDRCLEDVVHIEVIDLRKEEERKQEGQRPASSRFTITGSSREAKAFTSLAGYPRTSVAMKEVGSGRGYHGIKVYEGVPLKDLVPKVEGEGAMDKVLLVTSTDGYRSLLSYGELFFSSLGERVIIGEKPILFDPFTSWEPVYRKSHPELSDDEVKKQSTALRAAEMKSIRDMLQVGKSVAVLEPGDPTIYGGWENWLLPDFAGRIEVVSGMSSFSAANAMMGKNVASNKNSMVLTTPWALQAHEDTVKSIAAAGDTMAIFMGLKELKNLLPLLKRHYSQETPVTVAYKAGITHEKRLVRTTLADLLSTAEREKEDFLGLVYVGVK
jgi:siroheme synthase